MPSNDPGTAPHIAIVGAGYAGVMALARCRMLAPEARLTLVEPRTHFEERIRLYQVAAGHAPRRVPIATICRRLRATHRAQRVQRVAGRTLELDDGAKLEADALILALGSRTRRPPGPARVLDTIADAQDLHAALEARPDARVTIVGGGATALEVATSLAARFPDAAITIWRTAPGWGLSAKADAAIDARLEARAIHVLQAGPVVGLDTSHAWSSEHREPHDLAVWCAGFEPSPLDIDAPRAADGRLRVDARLALRDGVFAAGDLAVPPRMHRMGCVSAMPTGAHAGTNAVRFARGEAQHDFRFRDILRCIALDPGHGVAQGLDGEAFGRVLAGRAGGLVKAAINQMVVTMPALERTLGFPLYRWPEPPRSLPAPVREDAA